MVASSSSHVHSCTHGRGCPLDSKFCDQSAISCHLPKSSSHKWRFLPNSRAHVVFAFKSIRRICIHQHASISCEQACAHGWRCLLDSRFCNQAEIRTYWQCKLPKIQRSRIQWRLHSSSMSHIVTPQHVTAFTHEWGGDRTAGPASRQKCDIESLIIHLRRIQRRHYSDSAAQIDSTNWLHRLIARMDCTDW